MMGLVRFSSKAEQKKHEIKKGINRFREDLGTDNPNELDILIANLLRVYHKNRIETIKSGVDGRKEKGTLVKILNLLYKEPNEPQQFEANEIQTLLETNPVARKYLMLFKDQCPAELKNQIFIYEFNKCINQKPDGHWKRKKLNELLTIANKNSVNGEQLGKIRHSLRRGRTGRMLAHFNPNTEDLQLVANYKANSFSIAPESSSVKPAGPKIFPVENNNREAYYNRIAGIFSLAFHGISRRFSSIAGKAGLFSLTFLERDKKEANQFLKTWLKTEDAAKSLLDPSAENNKEDIKLVRDKANLEFPLPEGAVRIYKKAGKGDENENTLTVAIGQKANEKAVYHDIKTKRDFKLYDSLLAKFKSNTTEEITQKEKEEIANSFLGASDSKSHNIVKGLHKDKTGEDALPYMSVLTNVPKYQEHLARYERQQRSISATTHASMHIRK